MPQYTVTDPTSGKSVTLTGNSAPTEAELNDIFSKIGPAKPTGTPLVSPKGFLATAEDMARSIPGGLAQGVAGIAGGVGDATQFGESGIRALGNYIAPGQQNIRGLVSGQKPQGLGDVAANAIETVRPYLPGFAGGQTSDQYNRLLSGNALKPDVKPADYYYKPQTTAGRITETAASYAPAALGGEGSLIPRLARGALAPAIGSVFGGDAAESVGLPRAIGTIGGGLAGGVAANAPATLGGLLKAGTTAAQTAGDLRTAARAAYQRADNSGMIIDKSALKASVDALKPKLASLGLDADNTPNAVTALSRLDDAATQNQTFHGMDILHKKIGGFIEKAASQAATAGGTKTDKMITRVIQDHLDDFVENLQPSQVLANSHDPGAISALTDARSMYGRAARADQIQALIDKARLQSQSQIGDFSYLGFGKQLHKEFKKLALNPRGMSRFSPEEQQAINNVATGDMPERVLRLIGKMSPDQVIPALAGSGAAGIGALLGMGSTVAPAAALAMGAGVGAKAASTAMTERAAKLAQQLMLRGRNAAPIAAPTLRSSIGQIDPRRLGPLLAIPAIANSRQAVQ